MTEERFSRLEQKLDKFSDALVSIARTEEKISALEKNTSVLVNKIDDDSNKIIRLEEKFLDISNTHNNIKKTVWGLFSTTIGAVVLAWFKTGGK